eukprot:TRINITY_DN101289_c0_g1_i1.p1 TRINITY_DN101289_c0_g1~~TRINITY_DN101289_c0_g1_i1.p1  ORF type:complete len:138 (+),score=38.32 TRINITY_DN101289_c0_g1_i1:79-492(+)
MSGPARTQGWKGLTFAQKLIYSSAMFNVAVIGFAWVKRQMKMADKEAKEVEELQASMAEVTAENWSANSRFRCYFAAQQYHVLNSSGPEEETSREVQKMLEILAQCREDLYRKIPKVTPAMQSLQNAPAMPVAAAPE